MGVNDQVPSMVPESMADYTYSCLAAQADMIAEGWPKVVVALVPTWLQELEKELDGGGKT